MVSQYGDLPNQQLHKKFIFYKKKAARIIEKADYLAHTNPIFKKHKILKSMDQYTVNLASLMWELDHDKIPKSLKIWFEKPKHSYNTRFMRKGKIRPIKYNTKKFGKYSFRYEAIKY